METVVDAERRIKSLNQSVMDGRHITVEKVIVCTSTWVDDTDATLYSSMEPDFVLVVSVTPRLPKPKDTNSWKSSWYENRPRLVAYICR